MRIDEMTFEQFSAVNRLRCEDPAGFNHKLESWSTSDWFTAVLGELGEAANIAKKLNRIRDGIPGNKESEAVLRDNLRKELGDTFVYLDVLAQSVGISIGAAAVEVFNAKSDEIGCPIRIDVDQAQETLESAPAPRHEHETDSHGRQICTTSGEAPSVTRAKQTNETGQHESYVVLCESERQQGFVRPYRDTYSHLKCGTVTTMGRALSETYARDPKFYSHTFCVRCNTHPPVSEFVWTADGQQVGS